MAVGAYNTAFGYAVFVATHLLFGRLHYVVVLLFTYVLSILNAFVAYRFFVFRVRGHVVSDLVRFSTVYLGALAANLLALLVLVEAAGLGELLAQLLALALTIVCSWLGHKHFSFRRLPADVSPPLVGERP